MKRIFRFSLLIAICFTALSVTVCGASKPQRGGKLTIIAPNGPKVIGYHPKMGPTDSAAAFPGLETMLNMAKDRTYEPELAESYEVDADKKTMTFHIRKGVKFHDGSVLNADVVKWNYDLYLANNKVQYGDQINEITIDDEYTVTLHLKSWQPLMIGGYGWVPMHSKAAFEKNGQDWVTSHLVGTGPFKQVKWQRDVVFKWERFDDYWQEGKPYLDEIEYRYIPDSVTAQSLMIAKAGDIWTGAPYKEQKDMQDMGLVRKTSWPGMVYILYLNTANEEAPTTNKKVREALGYAIDREALTKTTGFGFTKPAYMYHTEGNWAWDPTFPPRYYNPEKAKQLLKEAGYPKGLKLDLLVTQTMLTEGEALKSFLGDIGIDVHLDIADPGRFWGSFFGTGFKDMCLLFTGVGPTSLHTFHDWFGHTPRTNITSFKRPDELIALSKESLTYSDPAMLEAITRKQSRLISDEALFIPLWFAPTAVIMQPGVHSPYPETGHIRWQMADIWKEK